MTDRTDQQAPGDETIAETTRPAMFDGRKEGWYRTWLPRLGMATLVAAGSIAVAYWILTSLSDFFMTLLIAFFVAFAMLPAVEWFTRRLNWRRGAAAGIVTSTSRKRT